MTSNDDDDNTKPNVAEFFGKIIKDGLARTPPKVFMSTSELPVQRWSIMTASEAMRCDRRLVYEKIKAKNTYEASSESINGDDHVPDLHPSQGLFARGNAVEDAVAEAFKRGLWEGEYVALIGNDQRTIINDALRMGGTPDGLYYNSLYNMMYILEFKSIKPPVPDANAGPKPGHAEQAKMNAMLLDLFIMEEGDEAAAQALGITHWLKEGKLPQIEGASVIYVDAVDFLNIQEFSYAYDPNDELYKELIVKAKQVMRAVDQDNPMLVAATGMKDGQCRWCPFVGECKPAGFSPAKLNTPLGAKFKPNTADSTSSYELAPLSFFVKQAASVEKYVDPEMVASLAARIDFATEQKKLLDDQIESCKGTLRLMLEPALNALDLKGVYLHYVSEEESAVTIRLVKSETTRLDREKVKQFLDLYGVSINLVEKSSVSEYITVTFPKSKTKKKDKRRHAF